MEYIVELLEPMGGITCKRLFGGNALCKDDIPFALAFADTVYFKVDDSNRKDYEDKGSHPFSYRKGGKEIFVSNWEVPADIIEDQEQLILWAEKAFLVGKAARKGKKK